MKRKKQAPSPAVQITPVAVKGDPTGNESLAEFRRRTDREQKEQREAEKKQMVGDLNGTMIQLRAAQRDALFKIPSDYLTEHCTLTATRVNGTPETIAAEIRDAFNKFRINLVQRGVTLHQGAMQKFRKVAEVNPTVDLRIVSNIQIVYEYMDEIGVFADADRKVKQEPPVQPAPRHNLDKLLETVSAESTEGRKKLQEAIVDSLVNREWANCWAGFADSLYKNFDKFMLTERQKQTFYDTMVRRNLNLNRPADYDTCRVALVRSGDLPSHLLYPTEKLAHEVEDADMNDYNVRREFARRTRQLAQN